MSFGIVTPELNHVLVPASEANCPHCGFIYVTLHWHPGMEAPVVLGPLLPVLLCPPQPSNYSPYAKVLVKSDSTPKNTIFNLLYGSGGLKPTPVRASLAVVLFAQNKRSPPHYAVNTKPVSSAAVRALQMTGLLLYF